jgi:hypothetical protein
MQEGKVVFAVGQIAQVRIQSRVYDGFWCRNRGRNGAFRPRGDRSDADPNTTKGPDIPAKSGNLRRAARARAAREVRADGKCDGSTVAGWAARVIAGRAVYR